MNPRSLTFRLVSSYCGLLLILGVAFAAYTYIHFDRYVRETTQSALASRADAIWGIGAGMLEDPRGLAALIEQEFAPEIQDRFIRITSGGRVIYQSGPPFERVFDPEFVPLPIDDRSLRAVADGKLLVYSREFTLPDGRAFMVESGQSITGVIADELKLAESLLVGLPFLLVLAAGSGYALMRRALAPVEAMITAAEALTFNSPRKRLPLAGTGDRIDALGRTLNRMLERLDNAYQHANQFSADAAHELRTPLTILRGELELLIAQRDLPADVQEAAGSMLEETARLSQIVDSLITLSSLDGVAGKREHRRIDLNALALETIDQMRLMADEKNIVLAGPSGTPVFVAGDHDRLKQVLVNLLDNAIKYTPQGGNVTVGVSEQAEAAVLTVSDTGIGIAADHTELVFERFFRAATDRGEIGAGLGLAIVRSICTAHGGHISVESTPGKGSTFRVELPVAAVHLVAATSDSAARQRPAGPRAMPQKPNTPREGIK